MAVEVRMPKLGMTMDTGVITEWLKNEGDPVARDEAVAEVTTEKITSEIKAPGAGVLRKILVPTGSDVPIGTLLALIVGNGEALPEQGPTAAEADAGRFPVAVSASRDSAALSPGISVEEETEIKASPVARRLAREQGVDLAQLAATMSGKRIQREDVLAYIARREEGPSVRELAGISFEKPDAPEPLPSPAVEAAPTTAIPLVGMRKAIADHLVGSLRNAAQLSVAIEVDFTELVRVRESILPGFQVATGIRPTFTDLLIVLAGRALLQHPILNSTLEDGQILVHGDVNMGVAVAIENGLIVPVIPRVQTLPLARVAAARTELARKAAEGRLSPDEVAGGTFTITNPGMPGADISTPILNSPQNAILGVGRILKKPIVRDDEICIRQMCWLSLTFDHRAMDGIPVARFLDTLSGMIQDPMKILEGV